MLFVFQNLFHSLLVHSQFCNDSFPDLAAEFFQRCDQITCFRGERHRYWSKLSRRPHCQSRCGPRWQADICFSPTLLHLKSDTQWASFFFIGSGISSIGRKAYAIGSYVLSATQNFQCIY